MHPFLGPIVEAPSPVLKRRIPTDLDARKVVTEQLAEQKSITRNLTHPFLGPIVEAPSPVLKRRIPTELDARNVATEVETKDCRINRHLVMHPFLCPTMLLQSLEALL
jgi:hypothetical protein